MQKIKEFLKRNWQIILYCAIFVALFFFMAFRATSVGTDAVVYRDFYEQIKSRQIGIKYGQWEIGFSALCYLFGRLLGLSYLWFQIFTSFVILTCFALFIWKNSSNKFLSLFIFIAFGLYFYSFNVLRQGLALAIFLANLTIFLKDRKWWKYFLLLPVAVLMHNSIILCYLLYVVFFIKLHVHLVNSPSADECVLLSVAGAIHRGHAQDKGEDQFFHG